MLLTPEVTAPTEIYWITTELKSELVQALADLVYVVALKADLSVAGKSLGVVR
jgi:hypothetical protein